MSDEQNIEQRPDEASNQSPLASDEQQAQNSKHETKNMEIHAHELHKIPGHGWKHYFFEFLMLFLAVFCGFLAENLREHLVEQNNEKLYIKSFYEDLTADENNLQRIINNLEQQGQVADSLFILMNTISTSQPANFIYMYLRQITRSSNGLLYVNDRTIVQLRNAGGMRLIRNKAVSDSMVVYYKEVDYLQFLFDESLTIKRSLREEYKPLLNARDFAKVVDSSNNIINPTDILYMRSTAPEIINNCLLEINNIRGLVVGTKKRIQALKNRATRIKKFIEKEYQLE
jgi:hypothetical protein